MLPRNGVCLSFAVIIFCITLSFVNPWDQDIYEEEEGLGKLVDLQQLQNKLQPPRPSRRPKPRPSYSGNYYSYPPPFYWPPPPPPPYYSPPSKPDRDDRPPRTPSCGRPRPLSRNLRALCRELPTIPICRNECRCCSGLRVCDPLCSGTASDVGPLLVYCSQPCLLNPQSAGCTTMPTADQLLPFITDQCPPPITIDSPQNCLLYCYAFPAAALCTAV